MTVDDLTNLLATRLPDLPRSGLAKLAEAVMEMCSEARQEEREACAKIADAKFNASNISQTAVASSIASEIRNR